jgi:hypothetical protein
LQTRYPIAAVPANTIKEPLGVWVQPGTYTVRLTVGGQSFTQPLTVKMDPRVKTPAADLAKQYTVSLELADAIRRGSQALGEVRALRARLRDARTRTGAPVAEIDALEKSAAAIEGSGGGFFGGGAGGPDSLARLGGQLQQLYELVQDADVAPSSQALAAVAERQQALLKLQASWEQLRKNEAAALDAKLK